jgi:hypothetical protein
MLRRTGYYSFLVVTKFSLPLWERVRVRGNARISPSHIRFAQCRLWPLPSGRTFRVNPSRERNYVFIYLTTEIE